MADAVAAKETHCKMIGVSSLAAMRSEDEGIETTPFTPDIKRRNIGEHEIYPIAIRRILFCIPVPRNRVFSVESTLRFAFIVDAIKPNNTLEKNMQFGVAAGVLCYLEQWLKDVRYDLFEILHHTTRLVYIVKTGHLDKPTDIR